MLISYVFGATSIIVRMKILTQATAYPSGLTGLTNASAGLVISTIADSESAATAYTQAGGTIQTIATLGTYAAPSANNCRFKEVDATNHPGIYEMQFANARFAATGAKSLLISISGAVTNLVQSDALIPLPLFDPYSTSNSVGAAASVTGAVGSVTAAVSVSGDFSAAMKTSLNASTPASVQNISAQTGDSFARLGAPVGASISADVAGVPGAVGARVISTAPTAGTYDEALAFALAGMGKSKITYTPPTGVNTNDGILTVYAKDGTTVLKQFTGVNTDANGNTTVRV